MAALVGIFVIQGYTENHVMNRKIRPSRPDFHRLGSAVQSSIATVPFSY